MALKKPDIGPEIENFQELVMAPMNGHGLVAIGDTAVRPLISFNELSRIESPSKVPNPIKDHEDTAEHIIEASEILHRSHDHVEINPELQS